MTRKNWPAQSTLDAERAALIDLRNLTDYAPRSPEYSLAAVTELEARLSQKEEAESQLGWSLNQAREETREAAVEFHEAMIKVKAEIIAQYGRESRALRAVGLKPRADYKPRDKKPKRSE